MRRTKESKDRESFIDKAIVVMIRKSEKLQNDFFALIVEYLTSELDVRDNVILNTRKNITAINNLGIIHSSFVKRHKSPFLAWVARRYLDIALLNRNYFRRVSDLKLKNVSKRVESDMFRAIGIVPGNKGSKVRSGSFLDGIVRTEDAIQRVKQLAIQSVSQGGSIRELNKSINNFKKSSSRDLPVHHLKTAAYDSFNQFDRSIGQQYANRLGLRAFIYQGGLIETSRKFCKDRNNKVWTKEEADKWRFETWQGKNDNYVPERDLGGHNCRHQADWISDELAIRLRPELREIWGISKAA